MARTNPLGKIKDLANETLKAPKGVAVGAAGKAAEHAMGAVASGKSVADRLTRTAGAVVSHVPGLRGGSDDAAASSAPTAPVQDIKEATARTTAKAAGAVADKASEKPVEEPVEKAATKVAEKAPQKPVRKAAAVVAEKAAEKPVTKAASKAASKAAAKADEKAGEMGADAKTEQPTEQPTQQPTQQPVADTTPEIDTSKPVNVVEALGLDPAPVDEKSGAADTGVEVDATPGDVASNVTPAPQAATKKTAAKQPAAKKQPATKQAPGAKLPPRS